MREFEKEWRFLRPSELKIDPLYQRNLDDRRVARMAKAYNPNLVNPPKVSFRDGKFWVFDGQHTIAMWNSVKGDKPMECRVFFGMTWLDEMELFVEQNGIDADPTTNDKLRASFNGGNPEVMDMVVAADEAGVLVDFKNSRAPGRCVATSTLFKSYKLMHREDFVEMLGVIRAAWPDDKDALSNQIILGLRRFYLTYKGRFRRNDLLKVLKGYTPNAIIREGKGAIGAKDLVYARIILRFYNKNRTSRRLEDEI